MKPSGVPMSGFFLSFEALEAIYFQFPDFIGDRTKISGLVSSIGLEYGR